MIAVLGFAGVLGLVTGLIHFYLWKRLVRDTTRPGRWRRAGTLAAVALAIAAAAVHLVEHEQRRGGSACAFGECAPR